MDIDALYFVVICVEEFQEQQINRSPVGIRDRSRSPPVATTKPMNNHRKNSDFIEQSNYHSQISNYHSQLSNYHSQLSNYSSKSSSPPIQEKKRLDKAAYENNSRQSPTPFDPLGLMVHFIALIGDMISKKKIESCENIINSS